MRKTEVEIGAVYLAKVSGKLVEVRIESKCEFGGWYGKNIVTGRVIRLRSAMRLRRRIS